MLRKLLRLLGSDRRDMGARAEQLAAEWLQREGGLRIVARNWRNPRDERQEIDLVCHDGEVLVFVEVKARVDDALVPGYYAVDDRKKRVLRQACKAYLARLRSKPLTFRFDVVEVSVPRADRIAAAAPIAAETEPIVRHFENVPLFPKHYRG